MPDHQAMIELLRKAEQDETLREGLLNARSPEEVARVATQHGVAVSAEDFRRYQGQAASAELTDAELEATAGGVRQWYGSPGAAARARRQPV